tara:strand:+ start:172895 stop:174655 length:1761 start_codon:yes stop_codon:yes gene_type:complete
MLNRPRIAALLLFALIGGLLCQNFSSAQEKAPQPQATETDGPDRNLSDKQEAISQQFKRFEATLHDLGEYMKKTDPGRADLLFRAFGQSKQNQMTLEMQQVLQMLQKGQLGEAVERQELLVKNMQNLLALLQSEDRMSEVEKEKQRIQDLLKDVNRLIGQERDVRAATERGGNPADMKEKQKQTADNAKKLIDKIDQQDSEKNDSQKSESNSESEQKDKQDQPKADGEQPDQKSKDGKSESKSDSDSQKSKDSESKGKAPQEGKSDPNQKGSPEQKQAPEGEQSQQQQQQSQQQKGQPGEPQRGENQQSEKQEQQTPGREQIEQARQEMEKAIEELEKKQKEAASKHQDDAIQKLAEAKEKLEEMLRQLREEERELMLAAMEARLQKILAQQKRVYAGTLSVGQVPEKERTSRHTARAVQLSREETLVGLEVDKALLLLTDEGSSVAFSEALAEVREDVQTVAYRLNRTQVGELTQEIEKDIISSLEEMIEALQKEMEKSEEEKEKQQQQQQQASPEEQSLVDMLAEIRMLRSLQLRVNNRTRRIEKMALDKSANQADIFEQLQQLSNRQTRIQNATYILATGKNK